MSNATEDRKEAEQELKEMEKQLEQAAEEDKAKAAQKESEPSPEPLTELVPDAQPAPEASSPSVTAQPSEAEKPKDDPMEWARKKGLKTPEDMARLLKQREQEYHESRQKEKAATPPPPPAWSPAPEMGFQPQFYQPPQQQRFSPRDIAPLYPQLSPEDVERITPLMFDVANAAARQVRQEFGQSITQIQRQSERNNELMQLMQDQTFRDERVQREINAVIDTDPSIFQRQGAYTALYEKALVNLARKQLQQGAATESPTGQKPPVTAGGGNGSSFTVPAKVSERDFDSWTLKEQEVFINSNGRIVPKK